MTVAATPAASVASVATPATAPTPAATPAPAPQNAGGFLDHIKIPESSPADSNKTTTPATPPAPAAAPGATPEPAAPKTGEQAAPAPFKATIRGRDFTGDELVKAYENSTAEGLRLNDTVKQTIARATALEARYAELQAKFDETPPFKVLSKDEIKELDPADMTEYIVKKNAWETQKETRKETLAQAQAVAQAQAQETRNYILSRTETMHNDAANFPGYKDLMPVMEQILDRVPTLAGMRETPDILYYAALGLQKYREGKVSQSAEETARQAAAAQASAQAAAAGGGNPQAPVGATNPADDDSDEAFNKRILEKAPKSIFR